MNVEWQRPDHLPFLIGRIEGAWRGFGECVTMGVRHEGKLCAVVVFHNWSPEGGVIELSAAAIDKRWLTRPVLYEMFSYCFDQAVCQLTLLRVSSDNKPMLRIAKAVGFDQYRIPRLRGRSEDEVICTLTEESWRANKFTRSYRGKITRPAPARP